MFVYGFMSRGSAFVIVIFGIRDVLILLMFGFNLIGEFGVLIERDVRFILMLYDVTENLLVEF